MPSSANVSWLLSYTVHDGITHYLTSDGLPPNNGCPPPPGYELTVLPPPAKVPAASSKSPPTVPRPKAVASYTFGLALKPKAAANYTFRLASQPKAVASYTVRPAPQPLVIPPTQFIDIRFISNGVRPHRDRFTGRNRDEDIPYTICRAGTTMRMKELMKAFDVSTGRGFTECKLLSDGRSWGEVQTFKHGDKRSEKTLEEVGWTKSRGVDHLPVWVCAYHEGLDEKEEKRFWKRRGFITS